MKIHQLPMGAHFEYEGQEYTKTGPQMASGKSGQRLIPKYALLAVLGGGTPVVTSPASAMSREAVQKAFDRFHAHCLKLVPADRHAELAAARVEFLATLG
jgi:hypothetical protein